MKAIGLFAEGRTKTRACDEVGISIATFEGYVKASPELQEIYREAEQRSYDAMAEALVDIDNHRIHGRSDPKMAAVVSKNIMFLLSKRRPKEYGERITVDHNVTMDKAIVDALTAGKRRATEALTVDATFEELPSSEEQAEIAALCSF
jgi:hypothetical protein